MFSFRKIMALCLTCCVSGAVAVASVSPQIEQAKKILVAEKAQWAYVQKTLGDSGLSMDKMHAWMRGYPMVAGSLAVIASLIAFYVPFLLMDKMLNIEERIDSLKQRFDMCCQLYLPGEMLLCLIGMVAILAGTVIPAGIAGIVTGDGLNGWLKKESSTALHGLVAEWPKHREKFPRVLYKIFDDFHEYWCRAQLKPYGSLLPINDQQAAKLIEGLMVLSTVAQIA
ncbi:MAG: hypothetical protein WCW33_00440 [Candidatus Babeliales bacterium]|jgi:hypothetical protein